jgi:hypothetical protein
VDGLTDVREIAQLFATKYRDLYTNVPYDKHNMQNCIVDELNASLSNSSYLPGFTIDYRAVKTAVARLKPGKKEGSIGFTSDHIIHAGDVF